MTSTIEHQTHSHRFKTGDHVYIKDFCRGCDRDHDRIGTVIRFIPALSASVEVLTNRKELDGATEDRYIVQTNKGHRPAVHEFHHAHQLFLAEHRWPPFCGWCGKRQQRPTLHVESACRDFYRRNGCPPSDEEWGEIHQAGDVGTPDWLDAGTPDADVAEDYQ